MGLTCTVQDHKRFNKSKGLIYIKDFNMKNTPSFKHGMKIKYQVSAIVEAKWIKLRNEHHTAWVITFSSDSIPQTIDIPGEQIITRVYPYKDKPMLCKKCQKYSHSIKFCLATEWTCGRCGDEHATERCTNVGLRSVHCDGNHWTGHRSCHKQMEEQDILDMQLVQKISRGTARQQYYERYPERGASYASTVARTVAGTRVTTEEASLAYRKGRGGEINLEQEEMEEQAVAAMRRRDECEEDKFGTDSDNLTSEKNERVREQAQKIFNKQKKSDRKGDQNESVRREKSSKSTPVKRSHKPKKSKPSSQKDDISDG